MMGYNSDRRMIWSTTSLESMKTSNILAVYHGSEIGAVGKGAYSGSEHIVAGKRYV